MHRSLRSSGSRARLVISVAAALAVVGGTGLLASPPAGAAPTTLYVSSATIGADTGCTSPGYNSIQLAVNAATSSGDTIIVCSGTYNEQVTVSGKTSLLIEGSGPTAPVLAPTALVCNATAKDVASNGTAYVAAPLLVSGSTGVTVSDLWVNGTHITSGTISGCGGTPVEFWGIFYSASSGALSADAVSNIALISGNAGNGMVVEGSATGSVTISGSTVATSGQDGIACIGSGTSCSISGDTVTGPGPGGSAQQNGIVVGHQATGTVSGNAVSEYNSAGTQGTCIALVESSGVSVQANTVTDCHNGIGLESFGLTPGSAMSGDVVQDNVVDYSTNGSATWASNGTRGVYAGAILEFGTASISASVVDNLLNGPGTYIGETPTLDSTPAGIQVGESHGAFSTGSVGLSASGNLIENWTEDVVVAGSSSGTSSAVLSYNDFAASQIGVLNVSGAASATNAIGVGATEDWWGCAAGPNRLGCTTTAGSVTSAPWLATLNLAPAFQAVPPSATATVTATLADEFGSTVPAPLDVQFTTSPNVGSQVQSLSVGAASFQLSDAHVQAVTVTVTLLFGPSANLVASTLTGNAIVDFGSRIAGPDAIGTSIAASQVEFPKGGTAGGVVLARDDFFSDALAGGPLAAAVNGPLLLTEGAAESSSIDPRTLAEIERVLPVGGTVYVLGGVLALSPAIDTTLMSAGYVVVREAGANEYDTAYLIALQLGSPSTVFEATGTNFYDALSAVPAAIEDHAAILLTNGSSQSFETGIYLLTHPGVTRYAIGGPLAAYGADPGAIPVYGQDLFSTSAAVAATFFPDPNAIGAATATAFPDAMTGGVFMATGGRAGPVLLVYPQTPLPTEILGYLASVPANTPVFVFGGTLAVSDAVLTALQSSLG